MQTTSAPPHTLEAHGTDTLILRLNAADLASVDVPGAFQEKVRELGGPFFLIVDLSDVKSLGTDASTSAPSLVKAEWFRGIAYVNASRTIKVMIKVFNLGMYLAGQGDFPYEYAKSLDEALGIVDRMRAEQLKSA